MPISVPPHLLERYGDRTDHFTKIHDTLLVPAIESAGLQALPTARAGTENIQAGIINDLEGADLVLADLSALNPNVFLELGIRSALDKPVCLVWDGLDNLPFDSGTLNTHKYDPRPVYELNREIERLADFITATLSKSDGRNELWKYFGSASNALPVAELDPEDASIHAKLDRLTDMIKVQSPVGAEERSRFPTDDEVQQVIARVGQALGDAGPTGLHGSRVRRICQGVLADAYENFLRGENLSTALSREGLPIRTDRSGSFFLTGEDEQQESDSPEL